jgi:hypothetical protein
MVLLLRKHMQIGGPWLCMRWLLGWQSWGRSALEHCEPEQNYGVHYHHAGVRNRPPGGQPTDCGMHPVATASLEHRGTEDFLSVCLGNNGSSAGVPEVEYHCHVAQRRCGASIAMTSPLLSMRVNADASDLARAPPWVQLVPHRWDSCNASSGRPSSGHGHRPTLLSHLVLRPNEMLIVCVSWNKFPHIQYRKWIQNNQCHNILYLLHE